MKLIIKNDADLCDWMWLNRGDDIYSIKGPAPSGAQYEDGTKIETPINIAWTNPRTGEIIYLEYYEDEDA